MPQDRTPRVRRERLTIDGPAFGAILRQARLARGWSQETLAFAMIECWRKRNQAGTVSSGWVKQVELGLTQSIDRERVACAAEALGIPVTRFLPTIAGPESGNAVDLALLLRAYGLDATGIDQILHTVQTLATSDDQPDAEATHPQSTK